jgi:hypothetical protein
MAELQRVTFRFGRDTELQYLSRVPEVGDRVTHGGALWVVTDVRSDSVGEVVTCERPDRVRGHGGGAVEAHVI